MFLFSFIAGFSQTTNTMIQDGSGTLLPNAVAYCPGDSFDLKVNAKSSSTESYSITEVSSFIIASGAQPVPFTDKTGNNKFSSPIEIGFPFEFFGKTYTQVVVGSNGRLVFGDSEALEKLHDSSLYIDRLFSGNNGSQNIKLPSVDYNKVYSSDPNETLSLAQIFAGYTDLSYYNSTDYDKIKYSKVTYSAKKGLLISFSNVVEITGNYSNTLSSQILLLEDNTYYIKIITKKDQQNAILGVQNETGTKAIWPVNNAADSPYNNGKWKVGNSPISYQFTPNQILNPEVKWYLNGNYVQDGNNYTNFSPKDSPDAVQVKIRFLDEDGNPVGNEETSKVTFKKIEKIQISDPVYGNCGKPAELNVFNPDPSLQYYWYNVNDLSMPIASNETKVKVSSGSYLVKAKTFSGSFCGDSDEKKVNISSVLPPFLYEGKTLYKCDKSSQSDKSFTLSDLVNYHSSSTYTVEFYDENGTLISSGVAKVSNKGTKTFTIKVKTKAGVTPSCEYSGTFTVTYLSMIDDMNLTYFPSLCFGTTSFSTDDFKTWTYDNIAQNVNPDFWDFRDFTIQFSSDGINYNSNSVNPYNVNLLYVKMTKDGFLCEWNAKVQFNMLADVIANTPTTQLPPQCASATEYFDLEKLILEINPDRDVTVTFHTSLSDAQTGNNPVSLQFRSGIGYTTLYIRVVNSLGCVASNNPSITLLVYYKPEIISINPIVKTNCENNSVFNLTQNISDLTDAQSPVEVTLVYQDQNGNVLSDDEVVHYDASLHGTKPSVIVKYNNTCSDVVIFDLQYNTKPVAKITTITVCDETFYSLEDFKNQVISNASGYTFTDENGNSLPSSFLLTSLPLQVKFLIKNTTTGCVSDPVTVTFYKGAPTVLNNGPIPKSVCDDDFDGFTTINLTKYLENLTSDNSASAQYFTDENLQHIINDPANFINSSRKQDIYVSIQSAGYCPSTGVLHLTVNTPTKSTTLKDTYYICYGDNIVVNAGKENPTFQWEGGSAGQSDSERIYTDAGDYSVTLTNAEGCSYTHKFTISADHQPEIRQIIQTNDRIEVHAEGGSGNYEYSFDGGATWQLSNIFPNPVKDTYTIQARSVLPDGSTCNGAPKSIYTIRISNVITPNDDGKNDTWIIKNLRKMSDISVVISDRYGRTVYSESAADYSTYPGGRSSSGNTDDFVWDGKANGRSLSTDTYWYVVKWYDPASLKNEIRTGWILLKNRD